MAAETLLGEAKLKEIDKVAAGNTQCGAVYPVHSCPWSPATFKKIAYNLVLSSDLDLGSIMAFAAKNMVFNKK